MYMWINVIIIQPKSTLIWPSNCHHLRRDVCKVVEKLIPECHNRHLSSKKNEIGHLQFWCPMIIMSIENVWTWQFVQSHLWIRARQSNSSMTSPCRALPASIRQLGNKTRYVKGSGAQDPVAMVDPSTTNTRRIRFSPGLKLTFQARNVH